jgi:hypothetical protein
MNLFNLFKILNMFYLYTDYIQIKIYFKIK